MVATTASDEVRRVLPETAPDRGRLRRRVGAVLLALVVLQLPARIWLTEPLAIRSASMSPTLVPGERVLTWKAVDRPVRRGDVVSFAHGGRVWVKRVVALAGDEVGLEDGRLVVDGRKIDEPWSDPALIDSVYFGPVRVPAGTVFVLGDHRSGSHDSRTFGPVPMAAIDGRVVAVVWPPGSAGPVESHGGGAR